MGLIKRIKKDFGKVMRKQSELPYVAKAKLEQSVSTLRKKNKTFNKAASGVSKVSKGIKKVYKSKAVQGVGKELDVAEKVPVLGSELKSARRLARGVIKDPFALKSNLLNLAQVTPIGGFENAVLDTFANKAKDKFLGKYEKKINKMDQDAKQRIKQKYKPKEAKPYSGKNTGIGGGLKYIT